MYYSSGACSIFICFIVLIYLFPILLGAHRLGSAWRICGFYLGLTRVFVAVFMYSLYSHSFDLF